MNIFRFGIDDYQCMRCGKVLSHEADAGAMGWAMRLCGEYVAGFVCPECLTKVEHVASITTSAMGKFHTDEAGRMIYEARGCYERH